MSVGGNAFVLHAAMDRHSRYALPLEGCWLFPNNRGIFFRVQQFQGVGVVPIQKGTAYRWGKKLLAAVKIASGGMAVDRRPQPKLSDLLCRLSAGSKKTAVNRASFSLGMSLLLSLLMRMRKPVLADYVIRHIFLLRRKWPLLPVLMD